MPPRPTTPSSSYLSPSNRGCVMSRTLPNRPASKCFPYVPVLTFPEVVAVSVAVGGGDVGGGVVGGDVLGGGLVGVGDFDGVGFPVVPPTLLPGATPPPWLMGGVVLVGVPVLWAVPDWVWVGSIVSGPLFGDGPLLEISTAMIATTPMAAAPMPANKNVLLPGLRGPG